MKFLMLTVHRRPYSVPSLSSHLTCNCCVSHAMEVEKKKKKNKKKKSKVAETSQEINVDVNEATSVDGDHVSYPNQHSDISDVSISDVNVNRNQPNEGGEDIIIAEAEKAKWLQREAALEETIQQLKRENNFYLGKEDTLQDTIKHLQEENITYVQKEISLMEALEHLEAERNSLIFNEHSIKETISSLNGEVTSLKAQVLELEVSRHILIQENDQLTETASELQSQIQILQQSISLAHSSDELKKDLNSEVASAYAQVEKLTTENAELREKVNELNSDLNQRSNVPSSAVKIDQIEGSASSSNSTNFKLESVGITSTPNPMTMNFGSFPIKIERDKNANMDVPNNQMISTVKASDVDEEIEHVSLEEVMAEDVEMQAAQSDDDPYVSLSDAPLIGAPFRLVSFLARYVSGADLVDKSSFQSNY